MATKTLRVELNVAYRLLSSPDSGQPEAVKFTAGFTNLGAAIATASKADDNRDTIPIKADTVPVVIDLAPLGTIDYLLLTGDGEFSVQFGAEPAKDCKSLWLSDGDVNDDTLTLVNRTSPLRPISITMGAVGH